jgi:cytochrome c biogenesis protein
LPIEKHALWSFFSSVKLTITLLVLIVLLFIAGTFIPSPDVVETFANHLSPGAGKVFLFFCLSDLYHSWLFYILLALLSLNLIICSINRFPALWRQYNAPHFPEPDGIFDNLPQGRIITVDKEIGKIKPIVESCLKKYYGHIGEIEEKRGHFFYAQRGRFSLFGVYIIHLSILIMITGAIIGSVFGLEADINIKEGESVNVANMTKGNGLYHLDFSIRYDKFTVEFYKDGTPKTYRSDLSFIKNGQVRRQATLLVNHPFTFEGFRFYQSTYGIAPEIKAIITCTNAGEKGGEMTLAAGDTFDLPQSRAKGFVLRVEENIMQIGPAVKLRIVSQKKDVQFWVFQHLDQIVAVNPDLLTKMPMFNPGLFQPFVFSLNRLEQTYFTGLHLVYDPGVPLVAIGGLLMVAGLIIVFFIPYQRLWVFIKPQDAKISIRIAGRSNRNDGQLQKKIDYLCRRIDEEIKA